jgi:hypothetical protein
MATLLGKDWTQNGRVAIDGSRTIPKHTLTDKAVNQWRKMRGDKSIKGCMLITEFTGIVPAGDLNPGRNVNFRAILDSGREVDTNVFIGQVNALKDQHVWFFGLAERRALDSNISLALTGNRLVGYVISYYIKEGTAHHRPFLKGKKRSKETLKTVYLDWKRRQP